MSRQAETTVDDVTAPPEGSLPAWAAALSGLIGAGVALGVGELLNGLSEQIPSLVVSVAEVLVDYTPGDLIATSIAEFGGAQKSITIVGIIVGTLLVGAAVGAASRRGRTNAVVVFGAFGVLGGWAAARNPLSSFGPSWFAAILAALAGYGTLRLLLGKYDPTRTAAFNPRMGGMVDDPRVTAATRRQFITYAGGMGAAAAISSGLGRRLAASDNIDAARSEIVLTGANGDGAGRAASVESIGTFDDVPGLADYVTSSQGSNFYKIDTAFTTPRIDPADWKMEIKGLVDDPYELTLDEILGMDLEDEVVTLSCVSNEIGGGLVGNAVWTGVPLADILDRAGIQPEGTQVLGRSVDDWTAGFPTELVYDGRTAMLVVGMNGEPLPIRHGFPARLVVAGLYGYVSAVKWLSSIELTRWDDVDGYWVPRGWSKEGPMKTTSRIDVPDNRANVTAGLTPVAGVAWAPVRGVASVQVSIDEGEWQTCRLAESVSDETWVQWLYEWDAPVGEHTIAVRATDKDGFTQSPTRVAPRPNGAEGHHTIRVDVQAPSAT